MKVPSPAAVILARKGNDANVPVLDRMVALATLGAMAEAGEVFIEVPDDLILAVRLSSPKEDKPKEEYVWRNGAWVKKRY
jgi:hypothetical protein